MWHVAGPLERDGVVGFKQFCVPYFCRAYSAFMRFAYFSRMPHKTGTLTLSQNQASVSCPVRFRPKGRFQPNAVHASHATQGACAYLTHRTHSRIASKMSAENFTQRTDRKVLAHVAMRAFSFDGNHALTFTLKFVKTHSLSVAFYFRQLEPVISR